MPSFIIYFAIIPLAIFALIIAIISMIENGFHYYINNKNRLLIASGIICGTIAIIILIISFFIK